MDSVENESVDKEIDRILNLKDEYDIKEQINTKFKQIAKSYRENIGELFDILKCRLGCKSNKKKYFIFKMAALVFNKSHHFRLLFCMNIYGMFKLITNDGFWGNSCESSHQHKREGFYNKKLRVEAYSSLARWCREFGPGYPQLLAHKEFLKTKLQLDIDDAVNLYPSTSNKNVITLINGRITVIPEESIEQAKVSTSNRLFQKTQKQLQYSFFDIRINLKQFNECLKLLKKDYLISDINKSKIINNNDRIKIFSTNNNHIVVTTLLDCVKLIRKQHVQLLEKYIQLAEPNTPPNYKDPNLPTLSSLKDMLKQMKLIDQLFYNVNIIEKHKRALKDNHNFIDVNEAEEHEILLDSENNYFGISTNRKRSST